MVLGASKDTFRPRRPDDRSGAKRTIDAMRSQVSNNRRVIIPEALSRASECGVQFAAASTLLKSLISTVCYCLYGTRGEKERDTRGCPRCHRDPADSRTSLVVTSPTHPTPHRPSTCPHFWFPFKHVPHNTRKLVK